MKKEVNLSLADAMPAMDSPPAMSSLLDALPDLSAQSVKDLAPLVFKVIAMANQYSASNLLSRMISERPEWVNQETARTVVTPREPAAQS